MLLIFSILTFISLEIGCLAANSCPQGWIVHDDSCYLFVKSDPKTWDGSVSMCKAIGLHLVEIESAEEDQFIRDRLSNLKNGHSYWIGGKYAASESHWVWAKSGHHIDYYNWAPGQPSNLTEAYCISLSSGANYLWAEFGCTDTRNSFICEKELQAGIVG